MFGVVAWLRGCVVACVALVWVLNTLAKLLANGDW
jgi:hypothetical protein